MPAPCLNLKIFGALHAQIYSSDSHSYNIKYRVIFQMRVSNGINFTIKIDLFYCLKLLSKYIKSHETFTYYSPLSRECSRAIPPPSPKIPPPDSPPSGGGAFPPPSRSPRGKPWQHWRLFNFTERMFLGTEELKCRIHIQL